MKRRVLLALAIVLVLVLTSLSNVSAHSFGSTPLSDVGTAASENLPTGVTLNEFKAMLLAVTWPEVASGSTGSPSPMAVGRWDTGFANLYEGANPSTQYPRAFWHPGVGMWQLDDGGLGASMSMDARVNSLSSARKAAAEMKRLWNNSSGTKAARRAAAWVPWTACNDNSCETIFNHIYNAATDSIAEVTSDPNVGRNGGMTAQTCSWTSGGATFTCWKWNPASAQGVTTSWQQDPNGATYPSGPTPLSTVTVIVPTSTYEYRFWLKELTIYTTQDIQAKRTMGSNSRNGLTWQRFRGICYEGDCS